MAAARQHHAQGTGLKQTTYTAAVARCPQVGFARSLRVNQDDMLIGWHGGTVMYRAAPPGLAPNLARHPAHIAAHHLRSLSRGQPDLPQRFG